MKRFYLPQLDGIRLFAFLLVFVHHAPSATHLFEPGSTGARICGLIQGFGDRGRSLPRVSVLIARAAARARDHGTHCAARFHVRRMLRIWPIYY